MKPNSEVKNIVFGRLDNDCIVVSNFDFSNTVQNITTNYAELQQIKRTPTMIGIWKIKNKC